MSVKCCKGCVPPKRKPGCHDHCPDYIKESTEDREWQAKRFKENKIGHYAIDTINKNKRRRER